MTGAPTDGQTRIADDVDARLRRLEDVESICRLKAAYCAGCDDDHDGDVVASLFAPTGTWMTTLGTVCANLDELRTHFAGIRRSGRIRHSTHMVTNPVVDVTGDSAVGTWSFVMMYTDPQGRRFRILGFYRDEFTRIDDEWRFQAIASTVQDYIQLDVAAELPVVPASDA